MPWLSRPRLATPAATAALLGRCRAAAAARATRPNATAVSKGPLVLRAAAQPSFPCPPPFPPLPGRAAARGAWARGFHEDCLPPKQQEDWRKPFKEASGQVTEMEQRAIMAVFDLIDLDENGVIDKSEQGALELILSDAGFGQKDITRALVEMDEDGNGEISREEFVQWWLSSSIHPRSKKIRDATRVFYRDDGRGDDKLD
mmetsp:Transcript_30492/g.76679  ORF Transcript_30492/g.76679 Transcript_30492/m.76679 type:complete len:201 (-) Transcript_30492:166-768(-)|eukprot:CAMPEP_0173423298 /NCGR_PEP_ID=MMETSP1357-20121228/3657_1 /TAXON_ID=77926 /ORGANISM="Hemiselmis rufescens, Strain PCC563" /LENGTH=200 /DNA_ID=CAMNT_0014386397 /DNA_START=75 /DNA_END=677 /DNA_ORIENTATION=-